MTDETGARPGRNLWGDLPVLGKVLSAVLVGVIASVAAGIVGIVQLGKINDVGGGIYERNLQPVAALGEIDGQVNEFRSVVLRHVISSSASEIAENIRLENGQIEGLF